MFSSGLSERQARKCESGEYVSYELSIYFLYCCPGGPYLDDGAPGNKIKERQ